MTATAGPKSRLIARILSSILLIASFLFYLQFGLQAIWHFLPQGILALVGAIALAWGAVQSIRRKTTSGIVVLGTLPMLLLHAGMTLVEPGELPFLIGSIPVPLIAAIAWLITRQQQPEPAN